MDFLLLLLKQMITFQPFDRVRGNMLVAAAGELRRCAIHLRTVMLAVGVCAGLLTDTS